MALEKYGDSVQKAQTKNLRPVQKFGKFVNVVKLQRELKKTREYEWK